MHHVASQQTAGALAACVRGVRLLPLPAQLQFDSSVSVLVRALHSPSVISGIHLGYRSLLKLFNLSASSNHQATRFCLYRNPQLCRAQLKFFTGLLGLTKKEIRFNSLP
ncbi:hypothetical protein Y032_0102g3455 [Ancylostoma ceylanicum]|uniref:Uncharacterized protein n=1 Tax=Ancylostoma ceylanicum TaxID=53326 RepID=A0A016THF1_9BILA|nr:hypothetical protein Y032_0102g3455 [Ancylostoma ceylanicum]